MSNSRLSLGLIYVWYMVFFTSTIDLLTYCIYDTKKLPYYQSPVLQKTMATTEQATKAKRTAKGKIQVSEKYFNKCSAANSSFDSWQYDVQWKEIEYLTCKVKHTQPFPSPASSFTNLLHLACFNSCSVFLIIGLFQNLTGYDL